MIQKVEPTTTAREYLEDDIPGGTTTAGGQEALEVDPLAEVNGGQGLAEGFFVSIKAAEEGGAITTVMPRQAEGLPYDGQLALGAETAETLGLTDEKRPCWPSPCQILLKMPHWIGYYETRVSLEEGGTGSLAQTSRRVTVVDPATGRTMQVNLEEECDPFYQEEATQDLGEGGCITP